MGALILVIFIAIVIIIYLIKKINELSSDNTNLRSTNFEITKNLREQKEQFEEKEKLYKNQISKKEIEQKKLLKTLLVAKKKCDIEIDDQIESLIKEDYSILGTSTFSVEEHIATLMADYYTAEIESAEQTLRENKKIHRSLLVGEIRKDAEDKIKKSHFRYYTTHLLLSTILLDHPEIDILKYQNVGFGIDNLGFNIWEQEPHIEFQVLLENYTNHIDKCIGALKDSVDEYKSQYSSNLTAIPWMARFVADISTIDLERIALSLSWGENQERKKKVASINELKKETRDRIENMKWAEYQLAYLLELYPALQDVIETEFNELSVSFNEITDYDPVRKYLSHEEWINLSESERNQMALDRYVESRKKSKWQIGRDYELYCGYCYEQQGYEVQYYGTLKGIDDLGRDLIVTDGEKTIIAQCKYWSQHKEIHENHIMQLYGSIVEYNIENSAKPKAKGVLITNISLSERAKQFAEALNITYAENIPMKNFPRIKCNIGKDENGKPTRIYHLPMDLNYDQTVICNPGEMLAMTVKEAEDAGFRRAYRWHGGESIST